MDRPANPHHAPPLAERLRPHRALGVLLATVVTLEIAHGIEEIALLPRLLTERQGEGAALVGYTLTAYLAADILARIPAGLLADRWGRRPTILLGLLLSVIPLPAMMGGASGPALLALNALLGVGAGCIWPGVYAAIADRYGPRERGRILGLLNTAMLGGLGSGPIIGNLLIGIVGMRATFLFCIGLGLLTLLAVALGLREGEHRARAADDPHTVALGAGLRALVTGELRRLGLVSLAMTFGVALLLPIINLFGSEVLGLGLVPFALLLAVPATVTALALIPLGRLADTRGRRPPLLVGLLLLALPFWLSPTSTHPAVVALGASVAGLGYAAAVPAWNALAMDRIPVQGRGLLLGGIAAVQGIGLVLGPSVGGLLWEWSPYAPLLLAAASFTVALALARAVRDHPAT